MDADDISRAERGGRAIGCAVVALAGLAGLVALFVRRRVGSGADERRAARAQAAASGLSAGQAAARLIPGQSNQLLKSSWRTRRQMIRSSTFTIFNLNLVFLAGSQLLIGRGWDALITLGVLLFNVVVNVLQEEFAQFRVRALLEAVQPLAIVRRDGRLQQIDADLIVPGDILHLHAGDPAPVDGVILAADHLLVDEGAVTGAGFPVPKEVGDKLLAGSICLQGRATCKSEHVGDQRRIARRLQAAGNEEAAYTAIERLLNRIMRILLVVMIVMGAVLLVFYFGVDTALPLEALADAISVVFNLAPAGLFLMVALTYVAATVDLAQVGAVVHRTRSVENLAQCDVICFAEVGLLTGGAIEAYAAGAEKAGGDLPEATAGALGMFAQSSAADTPLLPALREAYAGRRYTPQAEMPLMSVYGWCALVLADEPWRGTYVLGDSRLFSAPEPVEEQPAGEAAEQPEVALPARISARARAMVRPLQKLFRRRAAPEEEVATSEEEATTAGEAIIAPAPPPEAAVQPPAEPAAGEDEQPPGLLDRMRRGALKVLSRTKVAPVIPGTELDIAGDESGLSFMFTPEIAPLYDRRGEPVLPAGLVPLATLSYREELRPEAVQALDSFTARNVAIKLFTSQPPEKTARLIERGYAASATTGEEGPGFMPRAVTGGELAAMSPDEAAVAIEEHNIFGELSGQQAAQIVSRLRAAGRSVGVVGESPGDINAMRRGELALTRRRGSPGALSSADMVLLADSPLVLSRVVEKGQRIVNGLLEVLKLYLTQILYLILLIVAIPLVSSGFPYSAAQAGFIALITLTIPGFGLSLWAEGGASSRTSLSRSLRRFVLPAAFTMAVAGLRVYAVTYARYQDFDYAQLVLTYLLVAAGLLLVVFIAPPVRFRPLKRADPRPALLAVIAALLFVVATYIPLAQQYFDVEPLAAPEDYLLVGVTVGLWALAVQLLWWLFRWLD